MTPDFVFYADRLLRLVGRACQLEAWLGHMRWHVRIECGLSDASSCGRLSRLAWGICHSRRRQSSHPRDASMLAWTLQRSCVVCRSSGAARAWKTPCVPAVRVSRLGRSLCTGTHASVNICASARGSPPAQVPPCSRVSDNVVGEHIYEKLPADIAERFVMLMDPILATGNSAAIAIQVSCAW